MARGPKRFVCQSCGAVTSKWSGRCESCGEWNTIVEEAAPAPGPAGGGLARGGRGRLLEFAGLTGTTPQPPRYKSGIAEFDRVCGGGLVVGSALLIGGDPGIGKSTLLLQVAAALARQNTACAYISGEEALDQVRLRAERLGLGDAPVQLTAATSVRDIVAKYLAREGYEVHVAGDGPTALEFLTQQRVDLVVLDIMLPDINGLELCRWIKRDSEIPVIFLSALGDETDRVVGLELGSDDYVTKPFSPRELVARVKAVLRRTSRDSSEHVIIERGGLVINSSTREVSRNGESISLTALEFDLLAFMSRHPRMVFSREQLMSQVWGYDNGLDAGTNAVTVQIRRLREKIEVDPSNPMLLCTVWGVGYRFEA